MNADNALQTNFHISTTNQRSGTKVFFFFQPRHVGFLYCQWVFSRRLRFCIISWVFLSNVTRVIYTLIMCAVLGGRAEFQKSTGAKDANLFLACCSVLHRAINSCRSIEIIATCRASNVHSISICWSCECLAIELWMKMQRETIFISSQRLLHLFFRLYSLWRRENRRAPDFVPSNSSIVHREIGARELFRYARDAF